MRLAERGESEPWTCEVCGGRDAWGPGWEHYGSIRYDESCGHVVVTCSKRCRDSDRAAALILEFERTHRYSCKASA